MEFAFWAAKGKTQDDYLSLSSQPLEQVFYVAILQVLEDTYYICL